MVNSEKGNCYINVRQLILALRETGLWEGWEWKRCRVCRCAKRFHTCSCYL